MNVVLKLMEGGVQKHAKHVGVDSSFPSVPADLEFGKIEYELKNIQMNH